MLCFALVKLLLKKPEPPLLLPATFFEPLPDIVRDVGVAQRVLDTPDLFENPIARLSLPLAGIIPSPTFRDLALCHLGFRTLAIGTLARGA